MTIRSANKRGRILNTTANFMYRQVTDPQENIRARLRQFNLEPKDSSALDELVRLESEYRLAESSLSKPAIPSIWPTPIARGEPGVQQVKSPSPKQTVAAAKRALESAPLPECVTLYEKQHVPPFFHYTEEEQEDILMPNPSWIRCEYWIKDKMRRTDGEMLVPILTALSNKANDEIKAKHKKMRVPVVYGEIEQLAVQHSWMEEMERNVEYKYLELVNKIVNYTWEKR